MRTLGLYLIAGLLAACSNEPAQFSQGTPAETIEILVEDGDANGVPASESPNPVKDGTVDEDRVANILNALEEGDNDRLDQLLGELGGLDEAGDSADAIGADDEDSSSIVDDSSSTDTDSDTDSSDDDSSSTDTDSDTDSTPSTSSSDSQNEDSTNTASDDNGSSTDADNSGSDSSSTDNNSTDNNSTDNNTSDDDMEEPTKKEKKVCAALSGVKESQVTTDKMNSLKSGSVLALRVTGNGKVIDLDLKGGSNSYLQGLCIFVTGGDATITGNFALAVDNLVYISRGNDAKATLDAKEGIASGVVSMKGTGLSMNIDTNGKSSCSDIIVADGKSGYSCK